LQGGSTITQQLARNFFLTAEPTWRRKLSEAFIALILELRLTKEQIFTMYANEVYLGQRGSFSIHGFGEGSTAQFGKDISELTLAEAAMLAGIIPAPNAYSPIKHRDRAIVRTRFDLENDAGQRRHHGRQLRKGETGRNGSLPVEGRLYGRSVPYRFHSR
jgi:penicillin-binding protein 1B